MGLAPMIGAIFYTVLMHHRSPVAWFGYRGGWKWLRSVQCYVRVWRHYPEHFRKPGLWLLADGVPVTPKLQGRRRDYLSGDHFAFYLVTTPCWRIRLNRFLDWSCPAQHLPPYGPDEEILGRCR